MNRTVVRVFIAIALTLSVVSLPSHARQTHSAFITNQDVTLAFAGDVHFEGPLKSRLSSNGLDALKPLFVHDDFAMVNLETSIGTHGNPEKKRWVFQTKAGALQTLANAGIDAVTMANNHAIDYGSMGLRDTLNAKVHSKIPVLGIGDNLSQALKPLNVTIKGEKIAIFAFVGLPLEASTAFTWPATKTRAGLAVWTNHKSNILRAIRAAKAQGKVVIVFTHWGIEEHECPTPEQQGIARKLSDAGVDLIVGAHPHVLEGLGKLKNTVVAYSLGNFVWYSHSGVPTGILRVKIKNGHVVHYQLDPAVYGANGIPKLATGAAKAKTLALMKTRTSCAKLAR